MTNQTVLTIEDDEGLQTVIKMYLEEQGYTVLSGHDGKTCIEKISTVPVDVILLDLMLPDSDGLDLMTNIRKISKAPIIVVSGKNDSMDKVLGLELGADDYLGKPFEMRELYARIKSVLRRAAAAPVTDMSHANETADEKVNAHKLGFAGFILDRAAFRLTDKEGNVVSLTSAEYKILETLVNAAGRVLKREEIFEIALRQQYQAYDRAADIHMARLRKKLGDDSKDDPMIKTVRSVGYIFSRDVEILE